MVGYSNRSYKRVFKMNHYLHIEHIDNYCRSVLIANVIGGVITPSAGEPMMLGHGNNEAWLVIISHLRY